MSHETVVDLGRLQRLSRLVINGHGNVRPTVACVAAKAALGELADANALQQFSYADSGGWTNNNALLVIKAVRLICEQLSGWTPYASSKSQASNIILPCIFHLKCLTAAMHAFACGYDRQIILDAIFMYSNLSIPDLCSSRLCYHWPCDAIGSMAYSLVTTTAS